MNKTFIVMLLGLILASCADQSQQVNQSSPQESSENGYVGQWESVACEVRPQQSPDGSVSEWWLKRKISLEENRIEAEFTTFSDPGCETPLQLLSFAGKVDVVGKSPVFSSAVEANLTVDEYVKITPLTDQFAGYLNSAEPGKCGGGDWQVGEAQDILETGCAPIGVAPNEPTVEYEVLASDSTYLYFGARPVDGSFITSPEKRPKALLVPLVRKN